MVPPGYPNVMFQDILNHIQETSTYTGQPIEYIHPAWRPSFADATFTKPLQNISGSITIEE
jgi:hypothetical protein